MAWVSLTGRDIRLMDAERSVMDASTPVQSLDSCVNSATNYVRGYVEGGANTMEATGVPPECVDDAITIARINYLSQDPTGTLLTKIREKEWDVAMSHLRDVAKRIAAVTQGITSVVDVATGKWGSKMQIAMRTDFAPPPTPPPAPPTSLTFAGGLQIVHIIP
jgi:hypothetical protein